MIDVMAIQPLLGRSITTMLKSNFISIVNAQQNMVYNTISPRIINFQLNIISVLIRTGMRIFGIKSPVCEIVQKLPASVTQNRKNIFLNTVNGKKSWEWRKIDSKIISTIAGLEKITTGISTEISVLMTENTVLIAGTTNLAQKLWEKPPTRLFPLLQLEFKYSGIDRQRQNTATA